MAKSWTDGAPAPVALQDHAHLEDPHRHVDPQRVPGEVGGRHANHPPRRGQIHPRLVELLHRNGVAGSDHRGAGAGHGAHRSGRQSVNANAARAVIGGEIAHG